jgi:hypothetical protein
MQHHAAMLRSTRIPGLSPDGIIPVRLLFENPSAEYGNSFLFGIRESFARTFCRDAFVEHRAVRRGTEDTVVAIVRSFFNRADYVRQHMESCLGVYWMVIRIGVPREDSELPTLMPAMAGIAFSRKTVLATKLAPLLRNPDELETERWDACWESTNELVPTCAGGKHDRACAESILHAVFEGLQTGYELGTKDLLDTRLIGKLN